MQTKFIRAFVLALVLTGIGATKISATHTSKAHVANVTVASLPIPCPPSDPNFCGLD